MGALLRREAFSAGDVAGMGDGARQAGRRGEAGRHERP